MSQEEIQQQIAVLLEKKSLNPEDIKWVFEHKLYVERFLQERFVLQSQDQQQSVSFDAYRNWDLLEARLQIVPQIGRRVRKMHTLWKYSAAVVILICLGFFLFHGTEDPTPSTAQLLDKAPGSNYATLTLSDGSVLTLDSTKSGLITKQGTTTIAASSGAIAYSSEIESETTLKWNTLSTPNGGQYKVTLPDGTVVWLNAASSLTYPTSFSSKGRRVIMKGEAYFDVQKGTVPFYVEADKIQVRVIGTQFNINSYENELNTCATLLEGGIVVSSKQQPLQPETRLVPGQQALLPNDNSKSDFKVITHAHVANATAWKDGLFHFDGVDIYTLMRQLERWYDIKVVYKGNLNKITFKGKIYRSARLSDILDIMEKMGFKFKFENGVYIVTS